ncbi:M50 family metallopeptidase [Microbacterium oleivorans]|uniref:Site-2 protease family protein n=1 Tax=Microbacterium oleivorans TaxID=273677 RepID=A0A7D5INT2_9MICO|nr:site-2 protease family protein [Microbacterium oleivorans]QLD11059.1 site-2 protease family protein [Microbacterium oleivorans]
MTVLAFVIGVVLLVVGLAVSIALHEIGHLVPAKAFGVRVGRYMIGFGPTLWSRRFGETEYGVKVLPLGGYISMSGMYPPAPAAQVEDEPGTGGALGAADERASGAARARSSFFAAMVQDARLANAETLVEGDTKPAFYQLAVWKRVVIMVGGPLMNFLFAIVLFAVALTAIGVPAATTTIAAVNECVLPSGTERSACGADDPASPAAAAGILPGDVLVSVDGTAVEDFAAATAIIQDSPGRTIPVVVERDGAALTLQVTPIRAERELVSADGEATTAEVGFVGMTATLGYEPQPLWAGPEAAVERVGAVAGVIWQLPVKVYETGVTLVTGTERDPNGPLSVVGAGRLAGEVAATEAPILDRVVMLIGLLGSLNIALFVFNLLPLLPLDGGHVVVALWDGIKRMWAKLLRRPEPRPVDATKLVPVTFVVVIGLIVMGGTLILADLFNPVSLLG